MLINKKGSPHHQALSITKKNKIQIKQKNQMMKNRKNLLPLKLKTQVKVKNRLKRYIQVNKFKIKDSFKIQLKISKKTRIIINLMQSYLFKISN